MTTLPSDLEAMLVQLEQADDGLRALYLTLAENPDLADEREPDLRDLRAKRHVLAERVGLEMLTQRRNARTEPKPPESATNGAVAPSYLADGSDGSRITLVSVETTQLCEPRPPISPVPAPEAPISAEALDDWKRKARTSGIGAKAYKDDFVPTWEATLDKLMAILGAPRDLDVELSDEIDGLDAVGRAPTISLWAALPPRVQKLWLGMLSARTRAVKDLRLGSADRGRVKTIIIRNPTWAAEHKPGHVNGLKSKHEPQHGSWAEDARWHWSALTSLLREQPTELRQPYVKRSRSPDDAVPDEEARTLDPTWPLWPLVRGRNVLMIGGDPRAVSRERLERLFELRSLEWADNGPRRVQGIVQRIQRRTIDIVVVLKGFVDHAVSEPIVAAAKEAGVAWVIADRYGVVAMKLAFERFLAGERVAAAGS